jgi:hypothetical protein
MVNERYGDITSTPMEVLAQSFNSGNWLPPKNANED